MACLGSSAARRDVAATAGELLEHLGLSVCTDGKMMLPAKSYRRLRKRGWGQVGDVPGNGGSQYNV